MLCRNIRRFKFFIKMEILLNLSLSTFLCPVKKIDFLTQFFFDRNHFNFTLVMLSLPFLFVYFSLKMYFLHEKQKKVSNISGKKATAPLKFLSQCAYDYKP